MAWKAKPACRYIGRLTAHQKERWISMTLWTPTHVQTLLPAIIVMLVIAAVLRLTLGKKDRKIRMIPFQICACVLVLLEIGKQVLSLREGYDLYHLPFHFCSILIFLPAIMAFYRGKHEKTIDCITTAALAAVFIMTAAYPDLIYSAQNVKEFTTNFFSFHTVAFHNVAMLQFLLIPALELYQPEPKGDTKKCCCSSLVSVSSPLPWRICSRPISTISTPATFRLWNPCGSL